MKGAAHLCNGFKYNNFLTHMRKKKSRRDIVPVIKTKKKKTQYSTSHSFLHKLPFFLCQSSAQSSKFQSPAFAPKLKPSSTEILVLN